MKDKESAKGKASRKSRGGRQRNPLSVIFHTRFGSPHFTRRGAGVLLGIGALGIAMNLVTIAYLEQVSSQYASMRSVADGFRANQIAFAGLQAAISVTQNIPEEYLYTLGVLRNPPPIPVREHCNEAGLCTRYYMSYSIQPEDGKINLNNLVRIDDEPNESYRRIVERLFAQLDISEKQVTPVIDWIDENDVTNINGAEYSYYEELEPPGKIKNGLLYSLSELTTIKGFDRNIVYESHAPEGWQKQQEELASQTEDEENLIQPEDWILSNNVTAYVPWGGGFNDKLNINAIRYHALMSLSDFMSRETALAIFKLRRLEGGYIQSFAKLKELPELQLEGSTAEVTLYDELVGSGGDISGFLKTNTDFYRLVGVGLLAVGTENESEEDMRAIRRVWGIWDKRNRQLIYYSND